MGIPPKKCFFVKFFPITIREIADGLVIFLVSLNDLHDASTISRIVIGKNLDEKINLFRYPKNPQYKHWITMQRSCFQRAGVSETREVVLPFHQRFRKSVIFTPNRRISITIVDPQYMGTRHKLQTGNDSGFVRSLVER